MIYRLLRVFFTGILSLSLAFTLCTLSVLAQNAEDSGDADEHEVPIEELSFSSMPPITESGQVEVPGLGTISWEEGQTPGEFLRLDSFVDSFKFQRLSLEEIFSLAGTADEISLNDFKVLESLTLGDLTNAIPELADVPVKEIPLIKDLLTRILGESGIWQELSLENVLRQKSDLGNIFLSSIDLSSYGLESIPGIESVPIERFPGWEDNFISDIPGLADVPLQSFLGAFSGTGVVAILDIAFGPKEARRTNTITGSDVEGFTVPCEQNSCSHIELSGPPRLGAEALHGKQWIKGGSSKGGQSVRGGYGALAVVNGGKEPTGRPFGSAFKLVLQETIESEGKAKFAAFFRYCNAFGCTPYFIGPVPLWTSREGDIIPIGLGGALTPEDVPDNPGLPPDVQLPPGTQNDSIGDFGNDGSLCGTGPQGVDFNALAEAFSGIEGNYNSAGYYDPNANPGGSRPGGRGLGRYQYMTFWDDVRAIILSNPGGTDFLRRANTNNNSSSYLTSLEADMPRYFSPVDQDALFKRDQSRNLQIARSQIDPTTGKPFTGMRLIERIGQIHFGGPNPRLIDSGQSDLFGRLSIYSYGKELARNYERALKKNGRKPCDDSALPSTAPGTPATSGVPAATGTLINPTPGWPVTSEFGWRIHPITRQRKFHGGIDIGAPMGASVKAADGGVVTFSGTRRGYGQAVIISHGQGRETLYGHLSKRNVTSGQQVSQGAIIGEVGSTGNSTGPHLHFEVMENKEPINPRSRVKF